LIKLKDEACHEYLKLGQLCMIFIITNDLYNIKTNMIQSYKQNPLLQEKYDTIIIGSGMGGLDCRYFCKRSKVLVLRKTPLYAWWFYMFLIKLRMGCGNTLYRKMQPETSLLKKLFDYITDAE
jgi:all-trans-retinol 13,14-reductase